MITKYETHFRGSNEEVERSTIRSVHNSINTNEILGLIEYSDSL